jgi:hypothetical protein
MKTYLCILTLTLLLVLPGCKKESNPLPPTLELASGTGYTPDGAVIPVGAPVRFGISAAGSGVNITNLVVKKIMPDGSVRVVLDSGLNSPSFTLNRTFYQNVEDTAQWTIQVMDKNRQFATKAMTLYKDPNSSWGGIFEFSGIIMGYQSCTTFGHFLNPMTGQVWFSDTASLNQSSVQIIPYYFLDENIPSPTFSSAGEQGGGITDYYPEISSWTTKNYTKWDISVDTDPVPPQSFESCHNDSLLIVSYDEVWGKRKFKWADAGDIIPFLTATGKKGLIRVISADHDPAGTIVFDMKIQQ